MKNLIKLKVILVVFIIIFTTYSVVADVILPLPKPIIDEDIKIKTAKKKENYPKQKQKKKKKIKKIKKKYKK